MKVVGKFEKVSLDEFTRAMKKYFGAQWTDEEIKEKYDQIKLPTRATRGSAGHDFYSPFYFWLPNWADIIIPTGIKVKIDDGWVLSCYPRSGNGMTHYLRIANTVGLIDSDYYNNPTNEGHIMIKLRKESDVKDTNFPTESVEFGAGDAFFQGVFTEYGVAQGEFVDKDRVGGFGSTGK